MATSRASNFRVIDVPFEKGSITPILAAVHFWKKMPPLSKIYPIICKEEQQGDDKRVLASVRPVYVKMISGMSMVPLGQKIEKDGERFFLVSKCNDTSGTWRLQIPKCFLTPELLAKEDVLFVVGNGVSTVKEGKSEWSSILGANNDMRFRQLPSLVSITVNTADYPEIFRGISDNLTATLHHSFKIEGYESFVNVAVAGSSYMYSNTNPNRNINLDPNMSFAYGLVELR
jgi:hypothetical protein